MAGHIWDQIKKVTNIIRGRGTKYISVRPEERGDRISRSIGREGGSIIEGREGVDSKIETTTEDGTRGRIRRRTWKIKKPK